MQTQKRLRMRRLVNPASNKFIILPVDHGATLGPIPGIENIRATIHSVIGQSVTGLVLHKGSIVHCADLLAADPYLGVLLHVSASVAVSPHVNEKVLVATVEEGLRLGVDGISIHVNLGLENDHHMIEQLGQVSGQCERYGLPLLAMMYYRNNKDTHSDETHSVLAARVGMELGADVVKVSYTGSPQSFERVVSGCHIPVIVAGGAIKESVEDFLSDVEGAMKAGAAGIAVGRNVFQYRDPRALLRGLDYLINHKGSVKEVAAYVRNGESKGLPARARLSA